MLRFLVDEDLDHRILRGLTLREPSADILTVQDAGRGSADDRANLEFAAQEGRVLLTHDKRLVPFVLERMGSGSPMPGVFIVQHAAPLGRVVDDLTLLAVASRDGEWEGQILFLPLQ